MTPISQKCGEKQGNAFKVGPDLSFSKTFSILRDILPRHSKIIVHLFFCVFQTKLNKVVKIFCRPPEWTRNVQMIPDFSTLKSWMKILHG